MKKKKKYILLFVFLIVIAVVVTVGLVGYDKLGRTVVSINEINSHPTRYLNNSITVKGFYWLKLLGINGTLDYYITTDMEYPPSVHNLLVANINKGIDTSVLIQGGEYYWKGIFTRENDTIRLSVIEIQPV